MTRSRIIFALTALTLTTCALAPAHARTSHHATRTHSASHQFGHAPAFGWGRSYGNVQLHGGSLGVCSLAARLGGPCGCWASIRAFGRSVRELWLADNWLKFPRTSPHVGAAAVWPHRHVAIVVAVGSDNTVTVDDSWNHEHRVRATRLVFVDPK